MVVISLQTNNEKLKKQSEKIVKELETLFGKENITVDFRCDHWVSVGLSNVSGWVQGNVDFLKHKAKVHLFDTETQQKNYDIPFDIIDTIYRI